MKQHQQHTEYNIFLYPTQHTALTFRHAPTNLVFSSTVTGLQFVPHTKFNARPCLPSQKPFSISSGIHLSLGSGGKCFTENHSHLVIQLLANCTEAISFTFTAFSMEVVLFIALVCLVLIGCLVHIAEAWPLCLVNSYKCCVTSASKQADDFCFTPEIRQGSIKRVLPKFQLPGSQLSKCQLPKCQLYI